VYDPVGGSLAEPALRSMAWRGRYLVIGFAGGDIHASAQLPLLKGCSIVGVFWGSFALRERDEQRRNVEELWRMSRRRLVPVVGETHRLDDYAAAFESSRAGGRRARWSCCPDQGSPIASRSACTRASAPRPRQQPHDLGAAPAGGLNLGRAAAA